MCGRFTLTITFEELMEEDQGTSFHRPRYSVAPMQQIPSVVNYAVKGVRHI